MSVLSADVAQLEDIISDASTSIIRIIITFSTAFIIMFWMSSKLFNSIYTSFSNYSNGGLVSTRFKIGNKKALVNCHTRKCTFRNNCCTGIQC